MKRTRLGRRPKRDVEPASSLAEVVRSDAATRAPASSAIGNRAMQRALHPAKSVIARDLATDLPPGLPAKQAQEARRLLVSNPQGAIDAVVAGIVARGRVDASHFDEGRILYDAKATLPGGHFGLSSLTPGSGLPRPVRVVVGADALRSLAVLHQTIVHEYRHVLELRSGASSEAAGEVDAYIAEAAQLEASAAWRDMRYLSHLGAALKQWWTRLTEREQLQRRAAHASALDAVRLANDRRLEEQFRAQTDR